MMNQLPFLNDQKIPKLRKLSGVSKYGFSENDELVESALKELIQAVESKNHSELIMAVKALIDCIMAKEQGEGDASDSQQKAIGV